MSIVPQGGLPKSHGPGVSRLSFGAKLFWLIIAIWAVIVFSAVPAGGSAIFGVISPIFGFVPGLVAGFGVGFAAVGRALVWLADTPIFIVGLTGAVSGLVSAWLFRGLNAGSTLGRSFVSSLFSEDFFHGNAAGFVWSLIVSTAVGYAVAAATSSMGLFMPGTSEVGTMAAVLLGSGTGGGFKGEFISWIMMIFLLLGALLVAGAIVGASAGATVGAFAGFAVFALKAATQGAAENVVFRFFAEYQPRDAQAGLISHVVKGAAVGALEGILAGGATAVVLYVLRLVSIL